MVQMAFVHGTDTARSATFLAANGLYTKLTYMLLTGVVQTSNDN